MNPNVGRVPASLIRAIHARRKPGDIDMGLGEPTMRPDPQPFEAALEWVRRHGCPYSPNAGFSELRTAVADYLGIPGRSEEASVCIAVGSEEALYLALKAVVDPLHHEVLIVEPCYLAYAKLCILEGIRFRTVALAHADGFAPSADLVLERLSPATRVVVLNTPSNPTGRIWADQELRKLAAGLPEHVFVLSDEVYRELYYTAAPPPSIAQYHPATLVAGSLSKSNALTGLRLGWLSGPAEVISAATKVHQFVNTAADTFAQRVAIELFSAPHRLGLHRESYRAQRETLLEEASRCNVDVIAPQGAFYSMVRLPDRYRGDSPAAAGRLLEEYRVVTVPGRAFGSSGEGWLRVSWGIGEDALREGMQRLGRFLHEP